MFLNILSNILKTLNSEETPLQIGLGFALGGVIGLSSGFVFHTVAVFFLICVLNVSFRSAWLSFMVLSPLPFLLGGLYHKIGVWLLIDSAALYPFWLDFFNAPYLAFSGLNNTVVLGSLAFGLAAFIPLTLAVFVFVKKYQGIVKEKFANTALGRLIACSRLFSYVNKAWNFAGGKHA